MNIISRWIDGFKNFKALDIAIFELYLFLVGAIAGAYFSDFFKANIVVVVIMVVICCIWIFLKLSKK